MIIKTNKILPSNNNNNNKTEFTLSYHHLIKNNKRFKQKILQKKWIRI